MPAKKNFGSCSITNCIYKDVTFRLITELAYQKCQKESILETYSYLEIGNQLCYSHYCKIMESNQNKQKRKLKSQECNRKRVCKEKSLSIKEGNLMNISYNLTNISCKYFYK